MRAFHFPLNLYIFKERYRFQNIGGQTSQLLGVIGTGGYETIYAIEPRRVYKEHHICMSYFAWLLIIITHETPPWNLGRCVRERERSLVRRGRDN
jgi:hypothetical protein